MNNYTYNNIESSRREYDALPSSEWRKDYFNEENGGYIATHFLKVKDDLDVPGIAAEVKACLELALLGKHILRLPENIPNLIDKISINGKPYREILKFKQSETEPRGYPDAYFDGKTWDFKTSSFTNEDTLRHRIKDGRKADNVIFITPDNMATTIDAIKNSFGREKGSRMADGSWKELPDIYYLFQNQLNIVCKK